MTETRTEYTAGGGLKSAQERDIMALTPTNLVELRRSLIHALTTVEKALGCESSIKTREERRNK